MSRWLLISAILLMAASDSPAQAKRPSFDTNIVNDASTKKVLNENDSGPEVLRAQILLDRLALSVGQIDGHFGNNMLHAVLGLRATHGLPADPTVNESVWQVLNMDSAPALVSYTTTEEDFKGPFVKVPVNMMAQAKLKYLGYSSPLEGIAEKFHISPALLQKLNPRRSFRKPGEELTVPKVRDPIQGMAARVIVSKHDSTVQVFDAMGKLLPQYPCTTGSEHDPLPIGDWKVTAIYKNPKFHYNPNLFWDAKATDSKATIAPGPRNPVGVVWIDLSKEHYGIHGTPGPGNIGHTESHGCIRLTNWDAMELAGMVMKGTPVSLVE